VSWDIGSHAQAVSELFEIKNSLVAPVRWEGLSVLAFGAIDEIEHRRRVRRCVGAVCDRRAVERMYEDLLGLIDRDASSSVQLGDPEAETGDAVLRPPVEVDAVVVLGGRAEETIRRASYFAGVGRRIAVLSRRPRHIDDVQLRAMWLEVGVAVVDSRGRVERIAEPGERHGDDDVFRWWFAETAYEAHLSLKNAARRHPSAGQVWSGRRSGRCG
jgi:hypothetical protein